MEMVRVKCERAKKAAYELASAPSPLRDGCLLRMADALESSVQKIVAANGIDIERAEKNGTPTAMLDRLMLDEQRVRLMAKGLRDVAQLSDPLGEAEMWQRPNGLRIGSTRVPLGVIGIIYEARPNVTAEVIGLCVKTGNAVVLRGGSEAIESNRAIVEVLSAAALQQGLPDGAIELIDDTSREAATALMGMNGLLDVLIPRGGAGLIKSVVKNASVPVIETGLGNCHAFVDASADMEMALRIVHNAKVSRPAVCNAIETLLVHEAIAAEFLPGCLKDLRDSGVEVRGCVRARALVPWVNEAADEDYATEYDDYIIAVKVVDSLQEAIDHINAYGTRHSECIVTENYTNAQTFLVKVDAAAVYVNASTRFTDGGEFGFGAEMGISTQKLHARGPMGLKALTSIKYVIYGDGQIR